MKSNNVDAVHAHVHGRGQASLYSLPNPLTQGNKFPGL
jgi:hypothetical protein